MPAPVRSARSEVVRDIWIYRGRPASAFTRNCIRSTHGAIIDFPRTASVRSDDSRARRRRARRETHDFEHDTHVRPGGARHHGRPARCTGTWSRPRCTSTPCAARKAWSPPRARWSAGPASTPAARPNDKFIVRSRRAKAHVHWGKVNKPMTAAHFAALRADVVAHLGPARAVRAGPARRRRPGLPPAGADRSASYAWHSLFVRNLFIVPTAEELAAHSPEFTVMCAPTLPGRPGPPRHPLRRRHRREHGAPAR